MVSGSMPYTLPFWHVEIEFYSFLMPCTKFRRKDCTVPTTHVLATMAWVNPDNNVDLQLEGD